MTNDFEKALDALMKDVKDLRSDMKDVISGLPKKAGGYVDSVKESLHDSVAHRPFVSLLVAMGAGAVLAGLLRWGRR